MTYHSRVLPNAGVLLAIPLDGRPFARAQPSRPYGVIWILASESTEGVVAATRWVGLESEISGGAELAPVTALPTDARARWWQPARGLERTALVRPESIALLAPGRASATYADLLQQMDLIAVALADVGVTPDDRVVVVLPNGPEMASTFLGVGAVAGCAAQPGVPTRRARVLLRGSPPEGADRRGWRRGARGRRRPKLGGCRARGTARRGAPRRSVLLGPRGR